MVILTISDGRIRALMKRGYLDPNELDDMRAFEQEMNLFIWDELEKLVATSPPKRTPAEGTRSISYNGLVW
jgi:hypothetical protein